MNIITNKVAFFLDKDSEKIMPFPDSPRVVYGKNPLIEVICQLRFPTILRIDSEIPADYQERIRHEYPIFRQQPVQPEGLPPEEILQALPPAIKEALFRPGRTAYDFISEDDLWTVRLTRDFLALTCRKYERWEQFRQHLIVPLEALLEIYRPSSFSRIGLRYRNVIRRSTLNLQDAAWADLLAPYIACELASPETAELVQEAGHNILIRLTDERGLVRIQHGTVIVEENGISEAGYLLDNDFYLNQKVETEIKNVWNVLNEFKIRARRCFRWCISPRLHQAMEPKDT
jgi:uncharacterized protein (TIGR04255 family)